MHNNESCDNFNTIPYHVGINADAWFGWRNDHDIGYVQLAFKVIVEAMYDLVLGDTDDHTSASFFFFGGKEDSLYWLWAEVLGIPENQLPTLVNKYKTGHVKERDVEWIRNLCTTMKTI